MGRESAPEDPGGPDAPRDAASAATATQAQAPPLWVIVRKLSGSLCSLGPLDAGVTVWHVKDLLAAAEGVPAAEQLLVFGAEVVDNGVRLAEIAGDRCCDASAPLELQLVRQEEDAAQGLPREIELRMQEYSRSETNAWGQRGRLPRDGAAVRRTALAAREQVQRLKGVACHDVPRRPAVPPGALCLDVHGTDDRWVAVGGADQRVLLLEAERGRLSQALIGHTRQVSCVAFLPRDGLILSASLDASVRLWACDDPSDWRGAHECAHVFRKHAAEVTDLSVHPLGEYFVTTSRDGSWALHDLSALRCIESWRLLQSSCGCMEVHPDGLIVAGGTDAGQVPVWDIRAPDRVLVLEGHGAAVRSLSFPTSGWHVATGTHGGIVKLWDLRRPSDIQTLPVCSGPVSSVRFDRAGQCLAVAGTAVLIYSFESGTGLSLAVELEGHPGPPTDACFGIDARSLTSVSKDQCLRRYMACEDGGGGTG